MVEKEYAKAIYEVALEQEKLNIVALELEAFIKLRASNNDFKLFLESPSISTKEKKAVIDNSLKDFQTETVSLLRILLNNNRMSCIEDIYKEVNSLILKGKNIINVKLFSNEKLTKTQIERLRPAIESKLNCKNIVIENIVDSTLIGGVVIYANDQRIDVSTKGLLQSLKESL